MIVYTTLDGTRFRLATNQILPPAAQTGPELPEEPTTDELRCEDPTCCCQASSDLYEDDLSSVAESHSDPPEEPIREVRSPQLRYQGPKGRRYAMPDPYGDDLLMQFPLLGWTLFTIAVVRLYDVHPLPGEILLFVWFFYGLGNRFQVQESDSALWLCHQIGDTLLGPRFSLIGMRASRFMPASCSCMESAYYLGLCHPVIYFKVAVFLFICLIYPDEWAWRRV